MDASALLIGIDVYNSEALHDLPACKKDVVDLEKVFTGLGYEIFGGKPLVGSALREDYGWADVRVAINSFF
ncbi:MAG: caspase family protein, partial [Candidatus Methylarchaceae archaeon HK01B]|nr:caspase family protein [Candidatus Methylarchaceae archaeon HK01B]